MLECSHPSSGAVLEESFSWQTSVPVGADWLLPYLPAGRVFVGRFPHSVRQTDIKPGRSWSSSCYAVCILQLSSFPLKTSLMKPSLTSDLWSVAWRKLELHEHCKPALNAPMCWYNHSSEATLAVKQTLGAAAWDRDWFSRGCWKLQGPGGKLVLLWARAKPVLDVRYPTLDLVHVEVCISGEVLTNRGVDVTQGTVKGSATQTDHNCHEAKQEE